MALTGAEDALVVNNTAAALLLVVFFAIVSIGLLLLPPRPGRPEIELFDRQGVFVIGFGHHSAHKALEQWLDRSEESTLLAAIVRRDRSPHSGCVRFVAVPRSRKVV